MFGRSARRFSPMIAGGKDIITQPLYDTQQVLAAGTGSLTFFQVPRGGGTTLFGAGGKNLTDTNMELAGQLPSPWTFEIFSVALALQTDVTLAYAALILNDGNIQLNIGSKQFLQLPIMHVPGGAGIAGYSSAATTVAATTINDQVANNGVASPGAVYKLSRSITLMENENFNVALSFPSTITPSANTFVRLLLGGELSRSIQ